MRYKYQCLYILFMVTLTFFFITVSHAGTADDLIIIANPDVPVDSLTRSAIADIYQGYKKKWDNGQRIKVVMLKKGVTHESFAKSVVHLSPVKLKSLWKKVIFSGAGIPPKILRSEKKCVEYVAQTSGAIAYISATSGHEGVKIIKIQ